jgi:membrane associated rhomboid family serine protease
LTSPSLLREWERTPAGLHGQLWRTVTSLFVQDSWSGALSNLAFLLVLGIAAEQVTSRPRWLLAYFGAGLTGELVGYLWQPTGAGNSVAVCGLAGVLAVVAWRGDRPRAPFGIFVLLLWCGAVLSTWWLPLIALGAAAAVASRSLVRWRGLGASAALAALGTGVILCTARNIHGVALLSGMVIAFLATQRPPPAS